MRLLPQSSDHQVPNVLPAIAQWWNRDAKHVQSVVEILAEAVFANRALQIQVGGGNHPRPHGKGPGTPDALESPLLQHAQELGLEGGRQIPDLVEKDGSRVCELEAPRASDLRAGECPPLVSEELALDHRRGECCAVDVHQRPLASLRAKMHGTRHHAFPRSGLAGDQQRRRGSGGHCDRATQPLDRGTVTIEIGFVRRPPLDAEVRERPLRHGFRVLRKLDHIGDAGPHQANHLVDGDLARQHHQRRLGVGRSQPPNPVEILLGSPEQARDAERRGAGSIRDPSVVTELDGFETPHTGELAQALSVGPLDSDHHERLGLHGHPRVVTKRRIASSPRG